MGMLRITGLLVFSLFSLSAFAQTSRIEGRIMEQEAPYAPVEYAVISLSPSAVHTVANVKGEFHFDKVEAGATHISIQFIGKERIDTIVHIVGGETHRFAFRMRTSNFRLDEVVVVATQNKAGMSTSSTISRQAIDHIQASSLSDVMQLLPGVAVSNSDLNVANTISIRNVQASASGAASEANSLGTAIIVDGMPLSNNANLQIFTPTMNGSTEAAINLDASNRRTVAGGVDTRNISLDNIESIEVIRGIPSAEYGDLTSGAVIIKSRAGRDPLKVKLKTYPGLYQGSASKGLFLGEKAGNLNISGDYLYTVKKPTESYAFYQRLVAKALWSANFGKNLYATTSLDLSYGKDTRNTNPDDQATDLRAASQDMGISISHRGTLTLNKGWLKTVEYGLAGAYTDKHWWSHERLGNASGLYSTAMTDGATVSKVPGQRIYDVDGNELTDLQGAERAWTAVMPNEYYHDWDIFGKEINANAKIKANFHKRWDNISNRITTGVDFKTDGNVGKGKVYDEERPPLRATSGNRAYRERPYSDVPFIHQLGLYVEDRYGHSFGERDLTVTAGARYDRMNGKNMLSPRVNASVDVFPEWFTLRTGYGITAKAPTLLYLYPENAYFDYRLTPTINYDEFLLSKTLVYAADNPDLEIADNRKAELGVDVRIAKKYRLSVTAYDELMDNGYSFSTDLSTIRLTEDKRYSIDHQDAGAPPVLKLDNSYNVFSIYSRPVNDIYVHNRGVEFELDLGRFNAIRTSFYLNGSWMRQTYKNQGYSFSTLTNGGNIERNIGVYARGRVRNENELLLTTLRITHNIPAIGFVITLTPQLHLVHKQWVRYGSDMFEKYISYRDGQVYDFDPALKDDPEFKYLFPGIDSNRETAEKNIPTLFFNINLSKEIGDYFTASFFANNMFNSRPMYESTRTPGSFIELGNNIFFGFDLKVSIK
jgi:hypothetical protein